MLQSMFNLDDRLAELRQAGDDLRHEREARAAARTADVARPSHEPLRGWLRTHQGSGRRSRLAAR